MNVIQYRLRVLSDRLTAFSVWFIPVLDISVCRYSISSDCNHCNECNQYVICTFVWSLKCKLNELDSLIKR